LENNLGNRAEYIGGSDIGTLLGWSDFRTRAELLSEKLGTERKFEGNIYTRFGQENEKAILDALEMELQSKIHDRQSVYENDDYKLLLKCHADGVDGQGNLVECKTCSTRVFDLIFPVMGKTVASYMDAVDAGVKLEYYAQIQFNMYLAGFEKAILVYGERTKDFELGRVDWLIIPYDSAFVHDTMIPAIKEFISEIEQHRDNGTKPITSDSKIVPSSLIREVEGSLMQLAELKQKEKEFKADMLKKFKELGIKKFESDNLLITYVGETTRQGGLNEKALIEAGVDVDLYRKPDSTIKESIRFKLR